MSEWLFEHFDAVGDCLIAVGVVLLLILAVTAARIVGAFARGLLTHPRPVEVEGSDLTGVEASALFGELCVAYVETNDTDHIRRPSGRRVRAFQDGAALRSKAGGPPPPLLPGASMAVSECFELRRDTLRGVRLMDYDAAERAFAA